jgi:16S rRNA (guanine966-N2)-methyltransferase
VAGTARGRRLVAPPGRDTRPTSDRVRESIFNALHSLGAIEGAIAADLFAGSGALGIEALSRGAEHCTFVERDRGALGAIRSNLDAAGVADRASVVEGDVGDALGRIGPVDLALADPPYAFDTWGSLLDRLDAGIVVIESDRVVTLPPSWVSVREKQYGGTVVLIVRRQPAGPR